MKARRFYQYVEKEPHEVSILWKVLPVLIFVLIFLNSLIAAYNFGIIFDIFNYRCILFARPSFKVGDIIFADANTTDLFKNISAAPEDPSPAGSWQSSLNPQAFIHLLYAATDTDYQRIMKVPNTNNYYVIDKEIFFVNETMKAKIELRMMHTVFATLMMCNLSLFIPLLSLTIASALIAFVMFCGRGGKALPSDVFPGSWIYVYPLLVISLVMSVLYSLTSGVVSRGLEEFCSGFMNYTGHTGCSKYMNYFTKQQLAGFRFLWQNIFSCHIVYPLGTGLWAVQALLTTLRILNVADFHFRMVVIAPKKADWNEDDEEIELGFHPGATPLLFEILKEAQAREKSKVV